MKRRLRRTAVAWLCCSVAYVGAAQAGPNEVAEAASWLKAIGVTGVDGMLSDNSRPSAEARALLNNVVGSMTEVAARAKAFRLVSTSLGPTGEGMSYWFDGSAVRSSSGHLEQSPGPDGKHVYTLATKERGGFGFEISSPSPIDGSRALAVHRYASQRHAPSPIYLDRVAFSAQTTIGGSENGGTVLLGNGRIQSQMRWWLKAIGLTGTEGALAPDSGVSGVEMQSLVPIFKIDGSTGEKRSRRHSGMRGLMMDAVAGFESLARQADELRRENRPELGGEIFVFKKRGRKLGYLRRRAAEGGATEYTVVGAAGKAHRISILPRKPHTNERVYGAEVYQLAAKDIWSQQPSVARLQLKEYLSPEGKLRMGRLGGAVYGRQLGKYGSAGQYAGAVGRAGVVRTLRRDNSNRRILRETHLPSRQVRARLR